MLTSTFCPVTQFELSGFRQMIERTNNAYVADMLSQPACLRRLTQRRVDEGIAPVGRELGAYRRVILTGMGSSFSALRPLWLDLVGAGSSAWLVDGAECLDHFATLMDSKTLVIAASQSGRSAELVALAELARARESKLLAITNDLMSPLASSSNAAIDISVGIESAVSTKTYLNTLAVGFLLSRVFLQGDSGGALTETADSLDRYLENWRARVEWIKEMIGLPPRLFLLARGRSLAAAEYGALIVKEAARWPVEAQSVPQFRHGPLELADPSLTVVIFAGEDEATRRHNRRFEVDVASLGARAIWLDAEQVDGPLAPPIVAPELLSISEALPMQLLSIAIAEQTGVTPGKFRNVNKVTTVL